MTEMKPHCVKLLHEATCKMLDSLCLDLSSLDTEPHPHTLELLEEGLELILPVIQCQYSEEYECRNSCGDCVMESLAPLQEDDLMKRWVMVKDLLHKLKHKPFIPHLDDQPAEK